MKDIIIRADLEVVNREVDKALEYLLWIGKSETRLMNLLQMHQDWNDDIEKFSGEIYHLFDVLGKDYGMVFDRFKKICLCMMEGEAPAYLSALAQKLLIRFEKDYSNLFDKYSIRYWTDSPYGYGEFYIIDIQKCEALAGESKSRTEIINLLFNYLRDMLDCYRFITVDSHEHPVDISDMVNLIT